MIKIVVIDIDNCLTDGKYIISVPQGWLGKIFNTFSLTKTFHTRDFQSIYNFAQKYKVNIYFLTEASDNCFDYRMKMLYKRWKKIIDNGQIIYKKNIKNKHQYIENILIKNQIKWEDVAYFGDSINDLECMEVAGVTGCPKNADPKIVDLAQYVSIYNGGEGCVEDFLEFLKDYFLGENYENIRL